MTGGHHAEACCIGCQHPGQGILPRVGCLTLWTQHAAAQSKVVVEAAVESITARPS